MVSDADGATLLYVQEGKFQMGSTSFNDSRPQHVVTLDAFWIDHCALHRLPRAALAVRLARKRHLVF